MKFRKRILLLGCMVMLTGCAVKNVAQDITTPVESPGYTRAQMMMMILSQKQEITKAYTDEIWQKKVTDDGKTYEEVFLDDMRNFFKELKVLNLIAAERGIRLTTEEEAMMGEASNQYYNELKKQKTAFSDISHEEVDEMFKEYALAQKVNETIADSDTDEISEEEARVLKLQRIVVGDKNKAQELEAQVNAEGADFFAIAKQNSESILKLGMRICARQQIRQFVHSMMVRLVASLKIRESSIFISVLLAMTRKRQQRKRQK